MGRQRMARLVKMGTSKAPAAARSYRLSNGFTRDAVMGNGHLHYIYSGPLDILLTWVSARHWDSKTSLASWLAVCLSCSHGNRIGVPPANRAHR